MFDLMKEMLTQESFNQFLQWLDPDRSQVGEKYEEIRRGLIKYSPVAAAPNRKALPTRRSTASSAKRGRWMAVMSATLYHIFTASRATSFEST